MQTARSVQIVFAEEKEKGAKQENFDVKRPKTGLSAKRLVFRGKKTPQNDKGAENSQLASIFSKIESVAPRIESVTPLPDKSKTANVKAPRKMFYSQSIQKFEAVNPSINANSQSNQTLMKVLSFKDFKLKLPQADPNRISFTPHVGIANLLNHETERKKVSTPNPSNNLIISSVRINTTTFTQRAPPKRLNAMPNTPNKFRITTKHVEGKQDFFVKSPSAQISKAFEEKTSTESAKKSGGPEAVENKLVENPPLCLQMAESEVVKEDECLEFSEKNEMKVGDCESEFAEDITVSTNSRSHPADDLNSAENVKNDLNSSVDTNLETQSIPKPWTQTWRGECFKRPPPKVSAGYWAIFDVRTDKLISSKNANEIREIASLTKIMTAVLALEYAEKNKINLEQYMIRVSSLAPLMMGTTAKLREGDCLSLWDVLHALMLPSGNDAAVAIAESLGKNMLDELRAKSDQNPEALKKLPKTPIWCFINQMNQRVKELGMNDTRFLNPHGLTQKDNTSTASDIAKLSAFAMKNTQFRLVVKKKVYNCLITQQNRVKRNVSWENTNKLLKYGYDGLKTGTTPGAGPCLATSLQRGENSHLICVVLNCSSQEQRFADSRKLMEYGMRLLLHKT